MNILGIETSCDETAVSVVKNGREVLSNVIATSVELHKKTGGIVPEIAARDSAKKILPTVNRALKEAGKTWKDIDAIAITIGPGLAGSLMVGIETARTLAYLHKKPIIPVHHIIGHIYANLLCKEAQPHFPALVLTVSGGHNNLLLWKDWLDFETLGETLDDSAGEAFDKVAKMLGLGFPGGPEIANLAEKGNEKAFDFPRPMRQSPDLMFSYSGLKTAVLYTLKKNPQANKADISASFQEAVVDSLLIKLKKAYKKYNSKEIYLSGGVSANLRLSEKVADFCQKNGVNFYKPQGFSTDNGAMIAGAGYFIYQKSLENSWDFKKIKMNLNSKI